MNSIQTINWTGFYDLHDPSVSKRLQTLNYLKGYYKTTSIIYLQMLGMPVLKGMVVTHWDDRVRQSALTFCNAYGLSKLLVRTDKKAETGKYMRGGYIIDIGELDKEVNAILDAGRIAILLEPRSPYQDLYSLNAMFWPGEESILLEVVGHGFDASDIKRGDITPHETIHLPRRTLKEHVLSAKDVRRAVIDSKSYKLSVRLRLAKIGRLVTARSDWRPSRPYTDDEFEAIGREHLQSIGQTLLLENEAQYRPIPISLVTTIYRHIVGLPEKAKQIKIEGEPMVVSMTFFAPDGALTFWDIVWPRLKYAIGC